MRSAGAMFLPMPALLDAYGDREHDQDKRDVPHATPPCGAIGTREPYGEEGTPVCRLGDVLVTLLRTVPWRALGLEPAKARAKSR